MRIRLFILLLALTLLPRTVLAATVDVVQQGAWTLRTATSAQMTKDFFCASQAQFDRGYGLVVARNLLGQSSLVLTWPDTKAAVGSTVPLRITMDQKPLRDVTATVRDSNTLVAALGWDDDALNSLSSAGRVMIAATDIGVRYNFKDANSAITRLTSCTASLLDRLPNSAGLSPDVRNALKKAGIKDVHMVQVTAGTKGAPENFIVDGIFGGSAMLSEGKPDVSDRMLDYVDQLELLCRSRFSSDLGAPVPAKAGGQLTTAEAKCDTLHTGTVTALMFVSDESKARVYYFEADKSRADQVRALRDKLVDALKNKSDE